jgi:hypothetical protein
MALALAGCASGDPLTNELLTQRIAPGTPRQSVCAISGIGDTFTLQKIGLMVFGNSLDKAPIDAWGIDEFVTGRIGAHLGQRFDVKRIAYPKGAFASLEKPKPAFSESKDDRKEIVRGIVGNQKCDLVVVVTKSATGVGNTNKAIFGLGLLDMGRGIVDNFVLFAVAQTRVYDGKTFAVLGSKWAINLARSFVYAISAPHRQVDRSWWPASPAHVASDARLKQATMELLGESIAETVAELFPEQQGVASARR